MARKSVRGANVEGYFAFPSAECCTGTNFVKGSEPNWRKRAKNEGYRWTGRISDDYVFCSRRIVAKLQLCAPRGPHALAAFITCSR